MEKHGLISVEKRNFEFIQVHEAPVAKEDMFTFLLELFCPFVDSLWLTTTTLLSLENQRVGVMERMLVERAQWFGEKSYFERMMAYFDATSKESIRCALKIFMRRGILQVDDSTSLTLSPEVAANPNILHELISRIASYRKPFTPTSFARL